MQGRYKIITLCGSTRFKDEFMRVQKKLTLKGYIVISVGLFGHQGDDEVWEDGVKEMLDDMHFSKIDMADEIFVINPDGYIGESTAREIAYARSCSKVIKSLEPIDEEKFDDMALKTVVSRETYNIITNLAKETGSPLNETLDYVVRELCKYDEREANKTP